MAAGRQTMAETMIAPRPHFEAYTSRSRLYVADGEGVIRDVDGRDIQDLSNMGCKFSQPELIENAAPPAQVAEPAQEERVTKPAEEPKLKPKLVPLPPQKEE